MSTVSSTRTDRPPRVQPTLVLGLLLIAAGGVLLLDRMGHLDAWALVADWWPVSLIGLGLWWLLVDRARIAGGVTIVVGALVLAMVRGVVDLSLANLIAPIVLAGIGIGALSSGARLRRAVAVPAGGPASTSVPTAQERWQRAPTATAVFGDARIAIGDVDGADHAVVTAVSVFGDVEVAVPAGWRVVDRTTALLGTVRIPRDQPTYAEAPVVELHGLAIFGDAKVRYLDDDPRSEA
ncbi:LiaF transmembrane domain-containing protein [Egicoccus halophilus]|uniref:LiaF transmembrane domain-containing protein n=1 Tax=Egicoccus halophilus TaxID=1670830 RepID=A0A8J3AAZ1_9ACTN|nr:DUF5668 domain-containing protein [Egicoccus halophilus]GGI03617.1 hypothetical protein GCM10011354_04930 [Egicoccus halophilus]